MEEPSERFPVSLRGSWFGFNRRFREKLSENELPITPAQFTALRNLFENRRSPISQRELANLIASNENNLVSIINRLEDLGLIQRIDSVDDRRKNEISITPEGEKIFFKASKIAQTLRSEVSSHFEADELSRLTKYLMLCSEKLETIQDNLKNCSN